MLITTELTEVILLKHLKIIIISILIVMFTLLLVSCGKDSTDEPDVSVVSTSEETETTTLPETVTETETVTEPPETAAPTKAKRTEKTTVKKTTTTKKQTVTEAPDNSADGCIDDGLVY